MRHMARWITAEVVNELRRLCRCASVTTKSIHYTCADGCNNTGPAGLWIADKRWEADERRAVRDHSKRIHPHIVTWCY